jgi:hypothetical protein
MSALTYLTLGSLAGQRTARDRDRLFERQVGIRSVFGAARPERAVGRGSARPGWSDRVWNRRQGPHCRRAPFDPRSALRAWDSDSGTAGEGQSNRSCPDRVLSPTATSALPANSRRSAFGAARPDSEGGRGVERSDGSGIVVRVEPVALGRVDASVLMSAVSKWRGMSRDSLQRAQGGARFLRRSSPERQIGGARCPLHHSSGRTSVKNRTIRVPR